MTVVSDAFPYPERAQGVTSVTLAATPEAAGRSRRMVRHALRRWGLAALTEDAELVVSEIVTNSVKATSLADAGTGRAGPPDLAPVQVRVLLFPAAVIIEVRDRDPTGPVQQHATPDQEGGRGLAIVAALCTRWHYFPSSRGGKVVWAELAIPPQTVSRRRARRACRGGRDVPGWPPSAALIPPVILTCCAGYTGASRRSACTAAHWPPAAPTPAQAASSKLPPAHQPPAARPAGEGIRHHRPRPAPRPLCGYHPAMDR